jgi:hypothetical protein
VLRRGTEQIDKHYSSVVNGVKACRKAKKKTAEQVCAGNVSPKIAGARLVISRQELPDFPKPALLRR